MKIHRRPDCDVLVVGAGPTGLMAANLLKRSGVAVRIVDRRTEPSRESRAFAIQARTMELFQHIGVVDELLDRGVVNPGVEFYVGGERAGGIDYDVADAPDTPYPFLFLLPQSRTEAILVEDLSARGVEVERGVEVTGLEQDAEGVTARGVAADGREITVRGAYAIGADGAHSVVRKALGLPFEGSKYAQTFLLADCRVEWPGDRPLDHACFRVFMNGSSIGLFLPLDGAACSRVMATDHSGKADAGGAEASHMDLPELQAAFSRATGMDARLSDPVWTTRYRAHHRGVDRYREGRAFVAGDAAHIHSPAGGQGMNTGLQDAANLAWKLAAVLRHGAAPDLLDTYDAERRPVGVQVVATSDRMFSAAAGQTGWRATARDWIARPAAAAISNMKSVQQKAFRTLSELDIAYPPDFGEDVAPALAGAGPGVGRRAPNAAVARRTDVFDLTAGYGWTVLALSRKPLERDEAERAADALDALARDGVAAHLVARLAVGRHPRVVFVSSPAVFDAYGVRGQGGQATYLVRPDGYVAWRGDGLDVEGCRRFLDRFGLGGDGDAVVRAAVAAA